MEGEIRKLTKNMNSVDVLVVDDDDLLRRSLADSLKKAGFSVMDAHDGNQGLAAALEHHPKLILLDYQMPGKNGVEVLEALRADDWGKSVEVIFATNMYDMNIINSALQHGVHDYILKADVSLDQIVSLARKYVTPKS
jgi:CheY-like chemotaxis protein